MGRHLRHYAPGVAFHITARIALKQQLFEDERLRDSICDTALQCFGRSDAELIAYCIMPNHLHLILIQGLCPLSQLMQAMLRRIALRVQKRYSVSGRVFGTRFFSKPCTDPEYFRTMIVYTHLNPCRSGIADAPDDYKWSSHRLYADGLGSTALCKAIVPERSIFAQSDGKESGVAGYRDFMEFRRHYDMCRIAGTPLLRSPPAAAFGNAVWIDKYSARARSLEWHPERKVDLRDIAVRVAEAAFGVGGLAYALGPGRSRDQSMVKRQIADAASRAGHSGRDIAHFLGVSEARVSTILTGCRIVKPVRQTFRAAISSMPVEAKN